MDFEMLDLRQHAARSSEIILKKILKRKIAVDAVVDVEFSLTRTWSHYGIYVEKNVAKSIPDN
jgi:hypothetical protein